MLGRGYHANRISIFYRDKEHTNLPLMLFPLPENKLLTVDPKGNPTAHAFLSIMQILIWVIMQDYSILLDKYRRYDYIFNQFRNIFESQLFVDYQSKVMIHLESYKNKIDY